MRRALGVAALAVLLFPPAGAVGQAVGRGFDLERAGQYAQATELYLATLRAEPTNLPALLGLERVLPILGRLPELLPVIERGLTHDPSGDVLLGLLLRTLVALDAPDSAAAVAREWAARRPGDEAPYREWAIALEDRREFAEARRVLLLGRRAVGRPEALSIELAELHARVGDWESAAREWGLAVGVHPAQVPNAAGQLEQAPPDQRDAAVGALTGPDASAPARRLAAEALALWGEPERGWEVFTRALEGAGDEAAPALRRYADLAGALGTQAGRRVRGLALARYADLAPPELAARVRADAARALVDARDFVAARAVLERIAADPLAPPDAQALAQAALLEAMIDEGQLDVAEQRLAAASERLSGEDRETLRRALARARIARGELERAEGTLAADSTLEGLALRGWVALYRGQVADAARLFRDAGPYVGARRDATERTAMLALLQQISVPELPELGAALLALARGDSADALVGLRRAAARLDPAGGRPDVQLLAGRVAAGLGGAHDPLAAELFAEVVRSGGDGAAPPAAELEWARLLLRQGQAVEAVEHLEHLILAYPASAVVPEARRELDRARGAIPRS